MFERVLVGESKQSGERYPPTRTGAGLDHLVGRTGVDVCVCAVDAGTHAVEVAVD